MGPLAQPGDHVDAVVSLRSLPANFSAFIDEIAAGLRDLYGPDAGTEYRETARSHFDATVAHPDVTALGYSYAGTIGAILLSVKRGDHAQIPFLHVLEPFTGRGGEDVLLREAVRLKRAEGARAIISEFAAFSRVEVDATFHSLGFKSVERLVMDADLNALARPGPRFQTEELTSELWQEASQVLVDAYRDHPGRRLHLEVCSEEGARGFLSSVVRGNFGETRPAFVRIARVNGAIAGLIAGSRVAPNVGFVLHVAVRPEYRNRGLGQRLLTELGEAFRDAGYERVALGVTASNPALHLYTRLGFRPIRSIRSYLWWNDMPVSSEVP